MRKVVLFIATSIDGYIAGKDGDTEWLYTEGDFGYKAFYESIDTTLMGFNTYDFIRKFPEFPYTGKKNYVFTRKERKDPEHPVEYVLGDVASFTANLKKEAGQNIWLIGGGKINTILFKAGLIDQMIISIHPVALGEGIKLFSDQEPKYRWYNLVRQEVFERGLVQLTYEKA